jgi:hypothetical protein
MPLADFLASDTARLGAANACDIYLIIRSELRATGLRRDSSSAALDTASEFRVRDLRASEKKGRASLALRGAERPRLPHLVDSSDCGLFAPTDGGARAANGLQSLLGGVILRRGLDRQADVAEARVAPVTDEQRKGVLGQLTQERVSGRAFRGVPNSDGNVPLHWCSLQCRGDTRRPDPCIRDGRLRFPHRACDRQGATVANVLIAPESADSGPGIGSGKTPRPERPSLRLAGPHRSQTSPSQSPSISSSSHQLAV